MSDQDGYQRKSRRQPKPSAKVLGSERAPASTRASRREAAALLKASATPDAEGAVVAMAAVAKEPSQMELETAKHHDSCDACGDGGSLLCCDGCVRTFHFQCLSPPMDESELPDDVDWFCNICLSIRGENQPPAKGKSRALSSVFKSLPHWNPLAFWMPQNFSNADGSEPATGTSAGETMENDKANNAMDIDEDEDLVEEPVETKKRGRSASRRGKKPRRSTKKNDEEDLQREEGNRELEEEDERAGDGSADEPFEGNPFENASIRDQVVPRQHHFAVELGRRTAEYLDTTRLHYQERLRKFPTLDQLNQKEEMSNLEEEMHRLYEIATNGQNSRDVNTGNILAGPQLLNQMGGMFTQFLAWQRLMNLVGQVPENSPIATDSLKRPRPTDDDDSEPTGPSRPPPPFSGPSPSPSPAPTPSPSSAPAPSNTEGSGAPTESTASPSLQPPVKKVRVDSSLSERKSQSAHLLAAGPSLTGLESTPPLPSATPDEPVYPPTPTSKFGGPFHPGTPVTPAALLGLTPTPRYGALTPPSLSSQSSASLAAALRAATATASATAEDDEEELSRPLNFPLVPQSTVCHAELSGRGIWGETFRAPLRNQPIGFFIGRKNPRMDIDLSEFTDVRTISHKHCGFFYNSKMGRFEVENFGRNGTRLNGELFGKATGSRRKSLKDGDIIEVGRVKIVFNIVVDPKTST
eukprot:TRINITY_DN8689_c0_g1_i1.p1 TRINITY_DN8689_c0_g1~~TRINITY_DN8689_c0_g1_i1.p1  ORF type:complete len:732 (+),score=149.80 TRINITY_DN8689_c0_g1_i1:112-2196(+)